MILGEPLGSVSKGEFYSFFRDLNLFVDVEATTIVASRAPDLTILPVDLGMLDWKRSFFLAYFPLNLWNEFATMLLTFLATQESLEYSLSSSASNSVNNPITLQSGTKLYVWKHNILISFDDTSTFYVSLDSGMCETENCLYRRIDVWICGDLELQARMMAIASNTFDTVSSINASLNVYNVMYIYMCQVLSMKYPGLLRTNLGNSLVDEFIPLNRNKQRKVVHANKETTEKVEYKRHSRSGSTSGSSMKLSHSFPSRLDKQPFMRTQSEMPPTLKKNTSILQWLKENDVTFNCSTAVLDGVYGPNYIPFSVWECLEIAYHSYIVMHCGIPVPLEEYMPEIFLTFTSLPKFRHSTAPPGLSPVESSSADSYLLSDKEVQETGGFFLRHFYKPSTKETCLKHHVNHNRMVSK